MRTTMLISVLLIFQQLQLRGQETFIKTYPYWDASEINGIIPLSDGYILCGNMQTLDQNNYFAYFNFMLKTNLSGDTIFSKLIKTSSSAWRQFIIKAENEDQIFYWAFKDYDTCFLHKLSYDCEIMWKKKIPCKTLNDFIQTNGNDFIFLSDSMHTMQLTKTDMEGNVIWRKQIGYPDTNLIVSFFSKKIIELPGGNIKVAVNMYNSFGRPGDQLLYTFDPEGNFVGWRVIENPRPSPCIYDMLYFENNIILLGANQSWEYCISSLNQKGDTNWVRYYPDMAPLGYLTKLISDSQGRLICAGGLAVESSPLSSAGLFATDRTGEPLWQRFYEIGEKRWVNSLIICPDGGIAAGGCFEDNFFMRGFFMKTDSEGIITGPGIVENNTVKKLRFYPNPASESIKLEISPEYSKIEILDLYGRLIFSKKILEPLPSWLTINLKEFTSGFYLVHVFAGNDEIIEKLILVN